MVEGAAPTRMEGQDNAQPDVAYDRPAPMRLRRLKLSGFKSFVEPCELRIEPGLTGIVGPNGCGKSNLLEAIRWVMGESSPKSMRSGGMEDVIFAGTADRPQRNFAEVSLLAEVSRPVLAGMDPEDGELEVVRRIERGAGSAYRANGRDVRAKDIALIFADAATGAHSPALVSQGKIANVISARPAERRLMLEEAAGIAGLHVRRKDAEQKLRATETNLDRLQVMLGDMEARAGALRKQARAAERYRALSSQIVTAEARMLFARWRDAVAAADAARAESRTCEDIVAQAQADYDELQAEHRLALTAVSDARAAHQAARDVANRLEQALAGVKAEHDAARQRLADLDRQAERIAQDSAREDRLTHDATDALAALESEAESIQAELAAAEAHKPELAQAVDRAERSARENELALARAVADHARAQADIRVARSALDAARSRAERAARDHESVTAALEALGDAETLAAQYQRAAKTVETAQAEVETASQTALALEQDRPALIATREQAEARLALAKAEATRVEREIAALRRDLADHQSGEQALDQVSAAPGYEIALAAALGDDLHAAIGPADAETRGWTDLDGTLAKVLPAAPQGSECLVDRVDGPAALHARLAHVFVADTDNGQPLAPGQRLVTRDGTLRRWDGFVSHGDGAGAAERLERHNRLDALETQLPNCLAELQQAEAALAQANEAIAALKRDLDAATERRDRAATQLREALRARDQSEDALARDRERREDLTVRIEHSRSERDASKAALAEAEAAHSALPDSAAQAGQVTALERDGEATRDALRSAQAALSTLDQGLAQARERRAATRAEIKGWQARSSEAMQRLRDMLKRGEDLAGERAALAETPDRLAKQIVGLESEAEAARTGLAALAQAEQDSEARLRDHEGRLADLSEKLSAAREARAGAQARAEHQDERRRELARLSGERFECPAPLLAERHGFASDTVHDAPSESAEHERLMLARERLGPVNLVAADELIALEEELSTNQAEHDELVEAIHRLRGSIGSLNREGRQRLLAAFAAVDGHFQRLFERLFDGGKAHLQLVDSDDPLEAGLEIMAQPPGKRLSSLSLLSGGEQTLTAVALIFALFLTNPAPICVLDEVDAPLDDANIERFCDLLDHMVRQTETRYLIVTHNAVTMARMHRLFGVTMIEKGVSRLVSVDLGGAEELLAAE